MFMAHVPVVASMRKFLVGALMVSLLLAGCAAEEGDGEADMTDSTGDASTGSVGGAVVADGSGSTEGTPPTTPATPPATPERNTVAADARRTDGPEGDIDLDGIPDALETSLKTECMIAGRPCSELGIQPPVVGQRDIVLVQVGRSGVEQNWRLPASVWASAGREVGSHGIHMQVADLGVRDDINVSATWEDTTNAGRYWFLWVVYDDPAKGVTTETSGSQLYDLITLMERADDAEMLATILHETYHAMMGNLTSPHSQCADEEVGGPGHSDDPESVLYTSPECESNDGSKFRLGASEAQELKGKPFDVFVEMNAEGWFGTTEA